MLCAAKGGSDRGGRTRRSGDLLGLSGGCNDPGRPRIPRELRFRALPRAGLARVNYVQRPRPPTDSTTAVTPTTRHPIPNRPPPPDRTPTHPPSPRRLTLSFTTGLSATRTSNPAKPGRPLAWRQWPSWLRSHSSRSSPTRARSRGRRSERGGSGEPSRAARGDRRWGMSASNRWYSPKSTPITGSRAAVCNAGRRAQAGESGPGVLASACRSRSRARISSGVYARRRRSARATTTPVAATPARPASPSTFHHRIRCRIRLG